MKDEAPEREAIMQQWDRWRKMIAGGFAGSLPRDEFEALIDGLLPRADAPPTLAEAMTVPEVRAMVEALGNIREMNMTGEDENGHRWAHSDLIEQEIVAALARLKGTTP
jgi:hypothetical protein